MQRTFRSLPCCGLAIVVIIGMTATARAGTDVSVGDRIRFIDREGTTGGGEFGVAPHNTMNEQFRTFCVQHAEYMDFHPDGFNVAGLTDHTVLGNKPLKAETAFLFTLFRAGTLPGTRAGNGLYDYAPGTANHIADANDVQRAIWYLQGETGGSNNSYARFARDAVDGDLNADAQNPFGDTNAWFGRGFGNVRIMNLTWSTTRSGFNAGDHAQDQLVLVPTPTGVGAGAGMLVGLAIYNHRRRQSRAGASAVELE